MNLWVKVGVWILAALSILFAIVGSFLLWQNRAENKRILENYGEKYIAMLKDFKSASKSL